jgi:hypothetical protein
MCLTAKTNEDYRLKKGKKESNCLSKSEEQPKEEERN